jgi:hypothetical protein
MGAPSPLAHGIGHEVHDDLLEPHAIPASDERTCRRDAYLATSSAGLSLEASRDFLDHRCQPESSQAPGGAVTGLSSPRGGAETAPGMRSEAGSAPALRPEPRFQRLVRDTLRLGADMVTSMLGEPRSVASQDGTPSS